MPAPVDTQPALRHPTTWPASRLLAAALIGDAITIGLVQAAMPAYQQWVHQIATNCARWAFATVPTEVYLAYWIALLVAGGTAWLTWLALTTPGHPAVRICAVVQAVLVVLLLSQVALLAYDLHTGSLPLYKHCN
ncbi:hypothetical protein [Kutzneria albida]|uniref:Uncharacterized protein n=1 Tax=Kutzneria albida DSM 43870 TaxID=1449976 RepID=W5W8W0_9PSEU|nr:hypothetical protein [Kutzneria albida]AHH97382.1 hypothetical protein KALB_4018 [Kutzneria albida DSM 43870]